MLVENTCILLIFELSNTQSINLIGIMIFNMDELFGFYNFIHFSARIIEIVCLLITKMHFVASKAHYLYEMFEIINIDRQ